MEREALYRHVGDPAQVFSVRRYVCADGAARGMAAMDVRTGAGLRFTVLEDRGLDIYDMEYRGVNLSFLSKNGLVSGQRFSAAPGEFVRVMNGGMLFTAGLLNVGGDCTDEGAYHPLHGRIDGAGAAEVCAVTDADTQTLTVSGKLREAALFGENLQLTRRITAGAARPALRIEDTLDNNAPEAVDFAILYHFNLGYPFLDEGLRLYTSKGRVTPRDADAAAGITEYGTMSAPVDGYREQVFFHDSDAGADGFAAALAVNEALNLGVYLRYHTENLPALAQWKSMRSGDYALGLEPCNTRLRGRAAERHYGAMRRIGGFSRLHFTVELGVLDGRAAIDAFREAQSLA